MLKKVLLLVMVCTLLFESDKADMFFINGIVPITKYGNAAPYACVVDDERIHVSVAPNKLFRENKGAVAVAATSEKHGRAILVDEFTFFDPNITPEFQHFILSHECAHHSLGHSGVNSAYSDGKDKKPSESAADCLGAKELVKNGFGRREFDVILDQVGSKELMIKLGVNIRKDNNTHPILVERVEGIKQCLGPMYEN